MLIKSLYILSDETKFIGSSTKKWYQYMHYSSLKYLGKINNTYHLTSSVNEIFVYIAICKYTHQMQFCHQLTFLMNYFFSQQKFTYSPQPVFYPLLLESQSLQSYDILLDFLRPKFEEGCHYFAGIEIQAKWS